MGPGSFFDTKTGEMGGPATSRPRKMRIAAVNEIDLRLPSEHPGEQKGVMRSTYHRSRRVPDRWRVDQIVSSVRSLHFSATVFSAYSGFEYKREGACTYKNPPRDVAYFTRPWREISCRTVLAR